MEKEYVFEWECPNCQYEKDRSGGVVIQCLDHLAVKMTENEKDKKRKRSV